MSNVYPTGLPTAVSMILHRKFPGFTYNPGWQDEMINIVSQGLSGEAASNEFLYLGDVDVFYNNIYNNIENNKELDNFFKRHNGLPPEMHQYVIDLCLTKILEKRLQVKIFLVGKRIEKDARIMIDDMRNSKSRSSRLCKETNKAYADCSQYLASTIFGRYMEENYKIKLQKPNNDSESVNCHFDIVNLALTTRLASVLSEKESAYGAAYKEASDICSSSITKNALK